MVSTINSNILANLNLHSKQLWGMNQGVMGRVLMKKTRGKISRVSVPLRNVDFRGTQSCRLLSGLQASQSSRGKFWNLQ